MTPIALSVGSHVLEWDGRDGSGRDVPDGVYYARVSANGGTLSRRLVRVGE